MAASRVIASGIRCGACRTRFSSAIVPLTARDSAVAARSAARAPARPFTTAPLRLSDDHSSTQPRLDDADTAAQPATSPAAPQAQDASLPWYLQVDAPQQPLEASAHPFADRQRIPSLPNHPPPILEGFLQYVSVDLGIDDLTLLDCRHLDPPAALGPNLIILFGTARSEKHLHVSADRLCRWLRTEHKLSPHADGLLGRNELKIKLRRKARKAKMLSNAGAAENSLAADDGIRTGWICVNVGSVPAAESTPEDVPEHQDFAGFGGRSKGVSVVLQLFTEEKRVELDLETLWNGVLKTDRTRKKMSTPEDIPTDFPEGTHNPNGAVFADNSVVTTSSTEFQHRVPQAPLQTRAFHTTRVKAYGTSMVFERAGNHTSANTWLRPRNPSMSIASYSTCTLGDPEPQEQVDELAPKETERFQKTSVNRQREAAQETERKTAEEFEAEKMQKNAGGWRWRISSEGRQRKVVEELQRKQAEALASKLQILSEMPTEQKLEALGNGYGTDDSTQTPFLQDFDSCIPEIRDVVHYEAILKLYLVAQTIGHPHYPASQIYTLLQEMRVAGVRIPKHMFLSAFRALLAAGRADVLEEDTAPEPIQNVFDVLGAMQGNAPPVLDDEVILMLHDSVCTPIDVLRAQIRDQETLDKRVQYEESVRHELMKQIDMVEVPLTQDSYAHLLRSYALLGDMEGMWHVWRSTAMSWQSRSPYMYALALNGVAFTRNQKGCISAVRDLMSAMGQERPPVEIEGHVRDALMRCLTVIEPDIEKLWESGRTGGEWLDIWRRCMEIDVPSPRS